MAWHQIVFFVLLVTACAYAGARGGAPERIIAAALFAAAFLTRATGRLLFGIHSYHSLHLDVLLVDSLLMVVLWAVAMRSARFWPMAMASMHGAALLGHLARPLAADIVPPAYYALVAFWSFPIVILLAVATLRHRRRLTRYGKDYAWATHLPASYRLGASASES